MKKLFLSITLAYAAILLTQCRKADVQPLGGGSEPSGATMEVTVRVANGGRTDITPAGTVTWKQGDRLYVVASDGLVGSVSATEDGDPVVFTGKITALASAQTFRFYYVGDRTFSLDNYGKYTFNINAQDGTLAGIASHSQIMWGKTSGTVAVGQTDLGSVDMTSLIAIAHLNITAEGSAVNTVNVSGCYSSSTFNATTYNGSALPGTKAAVTMTFTSPASSKDCYIALLPGIQTLTFKNGTDKICILPAKTVAANTFYNSSDAIAVNMVKDHQYVDLGLSVEWAACNLGATNPEDYGDYYAWGETLPYYAEGYSQESPCVHWRTHTSHSNAFTIDGSAGYLWKNYLDGTHTSWDDSYEWNPAPYGTDKILKSGYDAATAVWGMGWRMPTEAEFNELIALNPTWTDNYNNTGVKGYIVNGTGTGSGNSIFMPADGYRNGTELFDAESFGGYWSSSLNTSDPHYSRYLYFLSSHFKMWNDIRCDGHAVRPVRTLQK